MEIYMVGGAVRDALLGLPVEDRDWVLVGADPQQLAAQGYLPVGKDFPVFLHPQTREEYALARTERKTAPGYHGFAFHAAPDVTLAQDLARRDLTINAMAVAQRHLDAEGRFPPDAVEDPYGGRRDLQSRVLRHVTDAFREDPVRILRVARFAARFADFRIAPETQVLMREMVDAGEVAALVAERVWQELARGLMEKTPSQLLQVLADCGALAALLPEVSAAPAAETTRMQALLDGAQARSLDLAQRFAVLCHPLQDEASLRALCTRLRVPVECRDLALLLQREAAAIAGGLHWDAAATVDAMERSDAFRRPERYRALLRIGTLLASIDQDSATVLYRRLAAAADAALALRTDAIARTAQAEGLRGPQIAGRIREQRVQCVAACLHGPAAQPPATTSS